MDNLPTPDELGEKLKRGEITEGEAIEIMSERARREAFSGLYGPREGTPADPNAPAENTSESTRRAGIWILIAVVVALALLYVLFSFLD